MSYSTKINSFRISLVLLGFITLVACGGVDEVALPINEAPTASSVSITYGHSGNAVLGDTLTGNYVYDDAENDVEGVSIYRWFRDGTIIGGATTLTYVLDTVDIAQSITFVVTPVATTGTVTGSEVSSNGITANSAPVANAGADQTPLVTNIVTLNGSASSDGDGDELTYGWSFTSVPAGSLAALSDSTALDPNFTVDRPGTYVVQLIVNDGTEDSDPDTVTISTDNSAPVANAGTDQTAFFGDTVTLNGSGSTDVDGDGLTYSWSFTSRPTGSTAILTGSTTVTPTFAIDVWGDYEVQLIVNDGTVDSVPDTVSTSTINSAPVANAGADQAAFFGDTVTLDGSASTDIDGDGLTYSWSFTSRPTGSGAILTGSTALKPTFAIDISGEYVVQLIVNDGMVDSVPDTVTISTNNTAPVADAGPSQSALNGDTVILDGSGSDDVDDDGLTYSWSITSKPPGSVAALSNPTAVQPIFVIDVSGDYVVQLIVNDGTDDSAPDSVTISTNNSAPVADAGANQNPPLDSTVFLDGSASSDADDDVLTYSWSFLLKPALFTGTLSDATVVNPSFDIDVSGDYVLQLIVHDGTVESAPDTVIVTTN